MLISLALSLASPAVPPAAERPIEVRGLSAVDLFAVADQALSQGRQTDAEAIYTALQNDPDRDIRLEARFRLARLEIARGQFRTAGVLLRQILDENPDAQPARLELAAVLYRLGDSAAASRELRSARAGALPPEVAQLVDRFSQALRSAKPYGATIQVGMIADSNVNRATRSDTLGTVIGDFTLSEDAKEKSGRGASVDSQAYGRLPLGRHHLLAAASVSADLYRRSRFNDLSVGFKAGPELAVGNGQLALSAGVARRWYGGDRLTDIASGQAIFSHPLGPTTLGRLGLTAAKIDNQRNAFESGRSYSGSLELETALTTNAGLGLQLVGVRQALRDPGFSTRSGQASLTGYMGLGRTTLTATATLGRLVADERLMLYPEKRSEWSKKLSFGATMRKVQVMGFSPTMELTFERNKSSIEIYDYRRTAFEMGVARAF